MRDSGQTGSIPVDFHDLVFGPSFLGAAPEPSAIDAFRSSLGFPELRDFFELWLAVAQSDGPPKKLAFPPERLQAHLGFVGIMERRDDPLDVVFRLAGTRIVEALGFELTGLSLNRAIPRGQSFEERYDMFWRPVFEQAMPRCDRAHLGPLSREFVKYHALHLPVTDDAGDIRYSLFRFLPG